MESVKKKQEDLYLGSLHNFPHFPAYISRYVRHMSTDTGADDCDYTEVLDYCVSVTIYNNVNILTYIFSYLMVIV